MNMDANDNRSSAAWRIFFSRWKTLLLSADLSTERTVVSVCLAPPHGEVSLEPPHLNRSALPAAHVRHMSSVVVSPRQLSETLLDARTHNLLFAVMQSFVELQLPCVRLPQHTSARQNTVLSPAPRHFRSLGMPT